MINTAAIKRINVSKEFFGVELLQATMRWFISDKESDGKISMNHVISKPYAIDKAFNLYESQRTEFANLYVSVDAVKVKQITDYMGNRIFENLDEELSGWLFLFDAMPFANWDHPCKYLFVVDKDNYEELESTKGLSELVQIEKVY